MSEQKGFGSKLLGIFVETDDSRKKEEEEVIPTGGGNKSAADLVAELASAGAAVPGPRRGAPPAPQPELEAPLPPMRADKLPTVAPGAPLDFEAIFRELGMDPAELDRVRKAEDLLKSLPEATPQAVKKQIVEASLRAFGFDLEKIAAAALNQRRALDTYVKVNENATAKAVQDAEAQVQALNEKIAALRADIEKRTLGLAQLSTAVQERKKDVQKVIDFFQGAPPPGTP
jgi:hypothetical protein